MFWSLEDKRYIGYSTGAEDIMDGIAQKNNFTSFRDALNHVELPSNIDCINLNDKMHFKFKFTKREIDFWNNCSTGTHSFTLFYYWLQYALYSNVPPSLIFIDEFDAFYHERLSQFVIEELKKIHNCQFILTTHDTSIMSNEIMRPDCLFLMYKDKLGAINKMVDKDLRQIHNIEKIYRAMIS
jgi:AAA15 family ATPase/GTPase